MPILECNREHDVLDAVASGRWPERVDEELRGHVASCAICSAVASVAAALQDDRDAAWRDARLPPAGRVWWRAEMRARHDAAVKAAQPIAAAIGLAAACAVGLMFAFLQVTWPRLWQSLGVFANVKEDLLAPSLALSLAAVLGFCLIVAPLALFLLFSDD